MPQVTAMTAIRRLVRWCPHWKVHSFNAQVMSICSGVHVPFFMRWGGLVMFFHVDEARLHATATAVFLPL